MARITEDMVIIFNQTLENLDCSFKLDFRKTSVPGNTSCEIVPANNRFIHSSIINLTDEFYETLENFFKKKGIELSYNNTGSIFWSKNGWDDVVQELQKTE